LYAFVTLNLDDWDADELAEPEAGKLAAVEHVADLLAAAAPALGERLGGEGPGLAIKDLGPGQRARRG
jgi:hypothetical protein